MASPTSVTVAMLAQPERAAIGQLGVRGEAPTM